MKIGVLSDTHDRHDMVALALQALKAEGAELLLHCGDITSVDTVRLFEGDTIHFVYGNCDYDHKTLTAAIGEVGGEVHDPFGSLEFDGRKIAWSHGHRPEVVRELINSGDYDFVFHGHTHVVRKEVIGSTTVINPGALHRAAPKTCGVLDTESGEWELLTVAS